MVDTDDDERVSYGQFVGMLNVIRSRGLVSAEQRRDYDRRWRDQPEHRDLILEELERIMEEYSEKQIREQEET